jgi:hypothetical protein
VKIRVIQVLFSGSLCIASGDLFANPDGLSPEATKLNVTSALRGDIPCDLITTMSGKSQTKLLNTAADAGATDVVIIKPGRKYNAYRCPSKQYVQEQTAANCSVNSKKYGSAESCKWAIENPDDAKFCEEKISEFQTYDKCRWAIANPIEYKCEIEAKRIGSGYWECVRIEKDLADRQLQRDADKSENEKARKKVCDTKIKMFSWGATTECH